MDGILPKAGVNGVLDKPGELFDVMQRQKNEYVLLDEEGFRQITQESK